MPEPVLGPGRTRTGASREPTDRRSSLPSLPAPPAGGAEPPPALRASVGTSFEQDRSDRRPDPEGPSPCARFLDSAGRGVTTRRCAERELPPSAPPPRGCPLRRLHGPGGLPCAAGQHAAPRVCPSTRDLGPKTAATVSPALVSHRSVRPAGTSPPTPRRSVRCTSVRRPRGLLVPDAETPDEARSTPWRPSPADRSRVRPMPSTVPRPPAMARGPPRTSATHPRQRRHARPTTRGSSSVRACSPWVVPRPLRSRGAAAAVGTPRVAGSFLGRRPTLGGWPHRARTAPGPSSSDKPTPGPPGAPGRMGPPRDRQHAAGPGT